MTPDQRAAQVHAVIAKMHDGMSEHKACGEVGINRATFRAAALKVLAGDDYARALGALAEDQAEKIEETLQDMRSGVVDAAMARVEIDTRKWFASKFLPKKYGDKTALVGPNDGPLQVQYEELTTDQLKAKALALLSQYPELKG